MNNDEQTEHQITDRVVDKVLLLVKVAERLKGLETQVARMTSDIDSEKRTRADTNEHLNRQIEKVNDRMVSLERANWKAAGAIMAFLTLIQALPKISALLK